MVASMTAFSRNKLTTDWGELTCEIRSVNHRYLEISVRMPELLRQFEKPIRDCVTQHLKRGKVEINIKYDPSDNTPFDLSINKQLTDKITQAAKEIGKQFPNTQIEVMDVLQWPGVLQTKETHMAELGECLQNLVVKSLKSLVTARQLEGQGIRQFLEQRLQDLQKHLEIVRKRLPEVLSLQKQRLLERINELQVEVNQDRVEQEIVFLAQKSDVAEEMQRLDSHIKAVSSYLQKEEALGRRLDFYMQEFNREANTLASKSIDLEMSQQAIEMKVAIEQMREQVQNIE